MKNDEEIIYHKTESQTIDKLYTLHLKTFNAMKVEDKKLIKLSVYLGDCRRNIDWFKIEYREYKLLCDSF